MENKTYYIRSISFILGFYSIFVIILIKLANIQSLQVLPLITPEQWLDAYPYLEISPNLIWMKPSSSIIVYGLGIVTILIGIAIIFKMQSEYSRYWWGIALIIWGIGTLVAGTSYQAFSYEIKCRDNQYCLWTSLWELTYLVLTVGSINCMVVSHAYAAIHPQRRKIFLLYAILDTLCYSIFIIIGAILPHQFLLSFEFMILFVIPTLLFLFGHNLKRFLHLHFRKDHDLIYIWLLLAIVMIVYYIYLLFDVTTLLWNNKIWFSSNDVLHIGLLGWMYYIFKKIPNTLEDYSQD